MKLNKVVYLALFTSVTLFAEMQSAYQKIDEAHCRTKVVNTQEGEWSVQDCGRYAGFTVEITEDDLRQNMILTRNGKHYDLDFGQYVSPAFSRFGKTIEWRFPKGKKTKPSAMISRYIVTEPDRNGNNRDRHYLVVTKITDKDICIVHVEKAGKDQNVRARKVADQVNKLICLKDAG